MVEWQTRRSQKPVSLKAREGSTPSLGTMENLAIDSSPSTPSTASVPSKKPSGCLKGCLIGCLVTTLFVAIALAIGGYIAYSQISKYLKASSSPKQTTLEIVKGTANVKSGLIADGTTITTGANSLATVTFTDSSQLRLDSQTTITVVSSTDIISIKQSLGRTWTRFINLTGGSNYSLETPNAVATVRGTAFSTEVTDIRSVIDVVDGEVTVNNTPVTVGNTATATTPNQAPTITPTDPSRLTDDWFTTNLQLDQNLLERSSQLNPLELLNAVRGVSPSDLATLQEFATKTQQPGFTVTETQATQLETLTTRIETDPSPADIAEALYIMDPVLFADREHWTEVARNFMPLIQRGMLQESLRLGTEE